MAVYGMRRSPNAVLGLDDEETAFLDANPQLAQVFARFCAGPIRKDMLLPIEDRPRTHSLGLDEVEEEAAWKYLFPE
jgi:hypothetical protein